MARPSQVQVFDPQRADWVTVMANYRRRAAAVRKARRLRKIFDVRVTDDRGRTFAQWVDGKRVEASV